MAQYVVNLDEYANRILNMVKAQHGFKRKDEAINYVVMEYADKVMDIPLRPEFIKKTLKIDKRKTIKVGTVAEFRKRYEK